MARQIYRQSGLRAWGLRCCGAAGLSLVRPFLKCERGCGFVAATRLVLGGVVEIVNLV